MTVSADFAVFQEDLFRHLIKNKNKGLKTIAKNNKLIETYLINGNPTNVKTFVNDLNEAILSPNVKNFKIFENALKERLLMDVLSEFRESDVLIRACQRNNKKAVKWLLTMGINLGVQDEKGMTALMYAVKKPELDFAVDSIIGTAGKHLELVDINGNSALFHATENYETLKNFFKYKDLFSPDQVNKNNENLILYACRNKQIRDDNVKYITLLNQFGCEDPNLTNIEGKTAAMYLVEKLKYEEIKCFVEDHNIDPNYVNKFGNSLLSLFAQKYYRFFIKRITEKECFGLNLNSFRKYCHTFQSLQEIGVNFNSPIDSYGNDITVILSKLKDEMTANYLLEKGAINCVVDIKTIENDVYEEVDVSNEVVLANLKTVKKWLTETYYPRGFSNLYLIYFLAMGGSYGNK